MVAVASNNGEAAGVKALAEAFGGSRLAERYRLGAALGVGAMGIVFEVTRRDADAAATAPMAVKLLRRKHRDNAAMRARFEREIAISQALDGSHLVTCFGHGVDDELGPYLLMERLCGQTLDQLLDTTPVLPALRAVTLVTQACVALEQAHQRGIVHRDLKPSNIFLCRTAAGSETVKVFDFGVAKDPADNAAHTVAGARLGTASYMAPEQARCAQDVDARADVYSLGSILYRALCGAVPHPGSSYDDVLWHLFTQPVRPLDDVRPQLPVPLCQLVMRALASNPSDRFVSASALAEALLGWQQAHKRAPRMLAPDEPTAHDEEVAPAAASPDADSSVDESRPPHATNEMPLVAQDRQRSRQHESAQAAASPRRASAVVWQLAPAAATVALLMLVVLGWRPWQSSPRVAVAGTASIVDIPVVETKKAAPAQLQPAAVVGSSPRVVALPPRATAGRNSTVASRRASPRRLVPTTSQGKESRTSPKSCKTNPFYFDSQGHEVPRAECL